MYPHEREMNMDVIFPAANEKFLIKVTSYELWHVEFTKLFIWIYNFNDSLKQVTFYTDDVYIILYQRRVFTDYSDFSHLVTLINKQF